MARTTHKYKILLKDQENLKKKIILELTPEELVLLKFYYGHGVSAYKPGGEYKVKAEKLGKKIGLSF